METKMLEARAKSQMVAGLASETLEIVSLIHMTTDPGSHFKIGVCINTDNCSHFQSAIDIAWEL